MSGFFNVGRRTVKFGLGKWDEEKHPRDGGKFAPKEGEGAKEEGDTYGGLAIGDVMDLGGSRARVIAVESQDGKARVEVEISKSGGSKRRATLEKDASGKTPTVLPQADLSGNYKPKQMDRADALGVVTSTVRKEALDGWFRNEDKNFKREISEAVHGSPELRDAGLNLLHQQMQDFTGKELPFDEFMASEMTIYRAGAPSDKDGRDTFASFTPDRSIAEKFGTDIEELRVKPSETFGSLNTQSEVEVLVPIERAIGKEAK